MRTYRNRQSGFTLVEILIVVIILGILAAIVIPQFTNASQDARKNSLTSQLQTIRSQLELYKLQHKDQLPLTFQTDGSKATWAELTKQTDADHANYVAGTSTSGPFGPYLQQDPVNSLNNNTAIFVQQGDVTLGGASPAGLTDGWVLNRDNGKCWATSSKAGFIYNESDANDPNNDK
jgi:general secretion pathway protein G